MGAIIKPLVVPAEWMPDCKMQRIITHWTGGSYKPNAIDRAHYHLLIDGEGVVHRGDHSISANASGACGARASHTLNCNTGSIGITVCCMWAADGTALKLTKYPMKRVQWNMLAYLAGTLARRYDIPVDARHVLGHGEVEANLGIGQKGKIDPLWLPWDPGLSVKDAGGLMRQNVRLFLGELDFGPPRKPDPFRPPAMWA